MRLSFSIGICLSVLIFQTHCQNQQPTGSVGPKREYLEMVSQSVTDLAQKISQAIASPKSKTEIFSPVSIAGALSLLLLGSGGSTKDELMTLMGFQNKPISFTDIHKSFGKLFRDLVSNEPSDGQAVPWRLNDKCNNYYYDEDEDMEPPKPASGGARGKRDTEAHFISIVYGIFINHDISVDINYVNLTKTLYNGFFRQMELTNDPRGSSQKINQWVQQSTRNKIQEIVTPDQIREAPLVLASALYFKSKWQNMFVDTETRPRPFFINGRQQPAVDVLSMATSGCFPFIENKRLGFKLVGLPYEQDKSTMYILLPTASDRQKLQDILRTVSIRSIDEMIDRMVVKTGSIILPKIQLESPVKLKDALLACGVRSVFDIAVSNLTGITKKSRESTPVTAVYSKLNPNSNKILTFFNADECSAINNCRFVENGCICNLDLDGPQNNFGCHVKPLVVAPKDSQTCTPEYQILSRELYNLCVTVTHAKCVLYCDSIHEKCYCCKKTQIIHSHIQSDDNSRRGKRQAVDNPASQVSTLYVEELLHKVKLDFNEQGTEEGTVTPGIIDQISWSFIFRVNGPFLIYLRHDATKVPLLYGPVYDPR